jgi:hypothetical protein
MLTRMIPATIAPGDVVSCDASAHGRISPPWLRLTLIVPLVAASVYAYGNCTPAALGMLSWELPAADAGPLVFLARALLLHRRPPGGEYLPAADAPAGLRLGAAARRANYLGFPSLGREGSHTQPSSSSSCAWP